MALGQELIQGEAKEMTMQELADFMDRQEGEFLIRIVPGKGGSVDDGGG